jgi:GDPmannose 4,6-dehydratase
LRPERFVTQKIVAAACRIAQGSGETLQLGNINVQRDWGWAPEYVEGMYRMLQQEQPDDYVLATGETYPLAAFVEAVFANLGLDWQQYVTTNEAFMRPTDIAIGRSNPSKAKLMMGWEAQYKMPDVAKMMVQARLLLLRS